MQKCCEKGLNFAKLRFANTVLLIFAIFFFEISYIFAKNLAKTKNAVYLQISDLPSFSEK
jgi:hypothetical protein